MKYFYKYNSPLGKMIMASKGDFLENLDFESDRYCIDVKKEGYAEKALDIFLLTSQWLDIYFSGENPDFIPPINPQGTEFRQTVWNLLLQIPYGQTSTYKEIAGQIALSKNLKSMSAQAVGGAVGHNPISIIIPCHRVVGTSGNLTGYAGGMDKKIALLKLEGVNMEKFFYKE